MATAREDQLRDDVVRLLDGTDLRQKVGIALQVVTVGPEGFPHPALLSVGEVLAVGPTRLRLALWASSTTTGNLRRRPESLLALVLDGVYHGIQLSVTAAPADPDRSSGLEFFHADVVVVHRDEVGYAELLSGVTYRLHNGESVLERWGRTVEALRALPDGIPAPGGSS